MKGRFMGPTLDARQFSTVTHAGTVSDPWPGSAILSALMALPATGGTVMVADGVWNIDSLLQLNGVNNFNLVGQSLNAQLVFTGAGQMWFGSAGDGIANATISTLTINATASPQSAMRISNAQNVSFNNNQILGDQNGSIPAVFFEGGSNNQILNNTITAGSGGGAPLQLQALGGTPNSGFVVSQNTFDSSGLLLIGLNNTKVTNNYFSNRTLGNFIGIDICGPYAGTSQNITIDGNTLDASIGQNGAVISGIPNDPGGTSNIDGFSITNNILKGTVSLIAVQSLDPSNFTDNSLIGSNKTNVTITGNQLSSLWAGSTIDIRGGAGSVDTVLVQSNTLQNSAGKQNVITEDAHTSSAQLAQTTYVSGSGADMLWLRVSDGAEGPWSQSFTVSDPPTIGAGETLELASAFSGQVSFTAPTGVLKLLNSESFAGTVAGMSGQDAIDFADIDATKVQQPTYSGTASGGTLTVTDGSHTANIALLGNYLVSTFVTSSDGHGGTNVVDPSAAETGQASLLVQPPHA
jgi:hypothetical protein